MLNACIMSNKQFTITDKKTNVSVTITEDNVSLDIGDTFENDDIKIEVKEANK